jgi:hypothetical protein
MSAYEQGQVVRATGTFRDLAGNLVDPSVVQFRTRTPAAVVTEYVYGVNADLIKDSTGVYHFDIPLSVAGLWKYRWLSTGVGAASKIVSVDVKEAEF